MAYPGNQELSEQAQERVIAAFRQVIAKLQAGERDEARIGLEFVLRLDPAFAPAANLHEQLANSSGAIDVGAIIGGLQAPSTDAINLLLVEAVEDFNNRDFLDARDKVKKVLLELPGHKEARELLGQVEEALRVETQVGQFLTQAREALDRSDPQEAANFVLMAQALDPHFSGIDTMLREIQTFNEHGGPPPQPEPAAEAIQDEPAPDEVAFNTMAISTEGFDVSFEEAPETPATTDEAQDFFVPEPVLEEVPAAEAPQFEDFAAPSFDFEAADNAEPVASIDQAPVDVPEADDDDFSFGSETARPAAAKSAGDELFSTDGDVADLFDAEAVDDGLFGVDDGGVDAFGGGPELNIQELLDAGARAFEEGDFRRAVDEWSRILEVDAGHEEARRRVDMARERQVETEQKFAAILSDAIAAETAGERDRARELVNAALLVKPGHPEASELKRRIQASTAELPPPAPGGLSTDTSDDLFSSDFSDADSLAPSVDDLAEEIDLQVPERSQQPDADTAAPKRAVPWRLIAVGTAAVLVIMVGVWLGGRFLASSEPEADTEAVTRVLAQAEELYAQRRVDEAIHLLRQFEASELDRERIDRRIAKYQKENAPPQPTPIPSALIDAEKLLDERQWIGAFAMVAKALEESPQDEGLAELKQRIMDNEPRVATLYTAMQKGDHRTAASIAEELAQRHPDHPEFKQQFEKSLFNAAVVELRAFNLTGAEVHLARLAQVNPDDAEVRRILKFISRYKAKPVDMQLEIFIKNLKNR